MRYFIDTEFIEGVQEHISKTGSVYTKPLIDLISIGIVCEDGREYYAISKDFYLPETWNRKEKTNNPDEPTIYWHRENILEPIYNSNIYGAVESRPEFSQTSFEALLNLYGKTTTQIAKEIEKFILPSKSTQSDIEFYGYYSAYDWVAFCQLFGTMMDLPKGFPRYCRDLIHIYDEKEEMYKNKIGANRIKNLPNYPKQIDKHNALSDAKWNFELFKFLKNLDKKYEL